jgi:putative transcriptional regulator
MKIVKKYRSDAQAAIHETMEARDEIGAVDKQTMREFDETCLAPVQIMSPEEIRELREREHLSQPVFARYLNVSKNLISDWERGIKKPGGPALRLPTVVKKKGIQPLLDRLDEHTKRRSGYASGYESTIMTNSNSLLVNKDRPI